MKKRYIAIIFILVCLFMPIKSNAEEAKTDITRVENKQTLITKSITIENFDITKQEIDKYELHANIENKNDNAVKYKIEITYYDKTKKIIDENIYNEIANPGSSTYKKEIDKLIYEKIKYYKIKLSTIEEKEIKRNLIRDKKYKYIIDNYDISIKINENNTLEIKEKINIYFNEKNQKIYKTIPLKGDVKKDISTRREVTDLKLNGKIKKIKNKNIVKIKLNSKNKENETKEYIISYTYNLGKKIKEKKDIFDYKLIANEWDTIIHKATFELETKENKETKKANFFLENKKLDKNNLRIIKENELLKGEYLDNLKSGQSIYMNLKFQKNYFKNTKHIVKKSDYLIISIPLISLMISLLLWYKYGRDEKIDKGISFYPPEEFNSLEVGYLYKGIADSQDITSLFLYLLKDGYIKIKKEEKNKYKIIKLKDYRGNNKEEKYFFEKLFNNNEEIDNETKLKELKDIKETILKQINSNHNKYKIFEEKASNKSIFIISLLSITFLVITIPPVYSYYGFIKTAISLLLTGGTLMLLGLLAMSNERIYIKNKKYSFILSASMLMVWILGFGGIPFATIIMPSLANDYLYAFIFLEGTISIIGMLISLKYLPKRTKYGTKILGELQGLKSFIELAEKENIENIVLNEERYFEEILPYAYAFGLSDDWIKKFDEIKIKKPEWYETKQEFKINDLKLCINEITNKIEKGIEETKV